MSTTRNPADLPKPLVSLVFDGLEIRAGYTALPLVSKSFASLFYYEMNGKFPRLSPLELAKLLTNPKLRTKIEPILLNLSSEEIYNLAFSDEKAALAIISSDGLLKKISQYIKNIGIKWPNTRSHRTIHFLSDADISEFLQLSVQNRH